MSFETNPPDSVSNRVSLGFDFATEGCRQGMGLAMLRRQKKNHMEKTMQRKLICILAGAAVALGFSIHAAADTTPEDALDYRIALMTTLRGHIGAASMIARGLIENRGQLVNHAEGLKNGVDELHELFPEGSNVGESEALPVIWEDREAFAEAISDAQDASAAFVEAAKTNDPDTINGAFRNLGMACRGCHDNFRVADD